MARGRAPGYDIQREAILSQAAELFARQGFVGTSMNEVATACGLSKPALYHYVRDKSQLLFEIATTHVARLHALIEEVAAGDKVNPPPVDATAHVRRLIERFVLEYAGARHAHRVLTEDVKFLEPADQARVLELQRQVVNSFANAIAQVRPELIAADLHKPLAMLLFGCSPGCNPMASSRMPTWHLWWQICFWVVWVRSNYKSSTVKIEA
jgi:AcrR family transcriptional regulator